MKISNSNLIKNQPQTKKIRPKTQKEILRNENIQDLPKLNKSSDLINNKSSDLINQGSIVFEDYKGKIKHLLVFLPASLLIMFENSLGNKMLNVYKILFEKMKDIKFTFVVDEENELTQNLEQIAKENKTDIDIITSPYVLDYWARDYFVPLKNPDGTTTLFVGYRYEAFENSSRHLVGEKIGKILAEKYPYIKLEVNKNLALEGGDVISNIKHAFVGFRAIEKTASLLLKQPEALATEIAINQATEVLSKLLNKQVIPYGKDDPQTPLKEKPPTFHIDVGVAPIDDNTLLVGDIKLALDIIKELSDEERKKLEKDLNESSKPIGQFSLSYLENLQYEEIQANFNSIAKQYEKLGYRVIRIPYIPGKLDKYPYYPYITYTNSLIETFTDEKGKPIRRVFMPSYHELLDRYAEEIYKKEGFEVIKLPSAHLTALAGAIWCNTQVLKREEK
ncbi:MAG: hypothetical protein ACK4GJ_05455 [bacterium]